MDLFGEPEAPVENTPEPAIAIEEPEVEAFGHPRLMNTLQGHASLEKRLIELFNTGRMPHGLIFAGPKGIGKATMAYRLARFILKYGSNDPNQDSLFGDGASETPDHFSMDTEDRIFRQVSSGGHPDLLTIERAYDAANNKTANSVAVADVRRVAPFLRMTSSEGGWRVVIIDDADTMNRNAQNALLKILEEPPEQTLIILVTHRLGTLIPTIRSRTQVLNFQAPSTEDFRAILAPKALSPQDMDTIHAITQGSIGAALGYIENDELENLSRLVGLFEQYPNWAWPDIHKLGDELSRAGQERRYQSFVHLILWIFQQMVASKARGHTQISLSSLQSPSFEMLLKQSSLESLLETCENLQDHFSQVERANLDKRQAVLSAFSIIAA